MERKTTLADVGVPTDIPGLDLVPSNIDLSAAEVQLVSEVAREQTLLRVLADVRDEYDYILIDCQPSLGLLTVNALTAAQGVIIPLECEFFSLRGVALLVDTIDKVKERLNPSLEIAGILATMYDSRTVHCREVFSRVVEAFGDTVFQTVIHPHRAVPGDDGRRAADHHVGADVVGCRGLPRPRQGGAGTVTRRPVSAGRLGAVPPHRHRARGPRGDGAAEPQHDHQLAGAARRGRPRGAEEQRPAAADPGARWRRAPATIWPPSARRGRRRTALRRASATRGRPQRGRSRAHQARREDHRLHLRRRAGRARDRPAGAARPARGGRRPRPDRPRGDRGDAGRPGERGDDSVLVRRLRGQ